MVRGSFNMETCIMTVPSVPSITGGTVRDFSFIITVGAASSVETGAGLGITAVGTGAMVTGAAMTGLAMGMVTATCGTDAAAATFGFEGSKSMADPADLAARCSRFGRSGCSAMLSFTSA